MISRWQRARDQLAADRRDLETRTLVERQFARWSAARGHARHLLLLRNPDLANAVDLVKRWSDELDAPTREFIKQSAKRARLVQTLTAAAAAFFAVIAGAAVYTEQQAKEALALARENESRGLAALSMVAAKNASFTDSVVLALAGWPRTLTDPRPRLPVVLESLSFGLSVLVPAMGEYRHDDAVWGALAGRIRPLPTSSGAPANAEI